MPPRRRTFARAVSESETDGDDSDFLDSPPPPKRAKRGKAATAAAKDKSKEAVHNVTPKHGLYKLPEMPLDIVFEILAYLDPVDLVHLMKVSNTFNTFLASDGTEPIWTAARRIWTFDKDELPPQPEDMAFHEFIDFLFGRYCHRCMKGTTLQTCFEVRARYCPPCRQIIKHEDSRQHGSHWLGSELKHWVGKIPLNESIADINIYSLMPVLSDKRYLQENLILRAHYPIRREDLAQFLDQLQNVKPKDQPKFLEERQEYIMRRRRDEPEVFHDFYARQLQNRADTVKGKKEERFNFIMDKLAELGWAQEVQLMDTRTLNNFNALPFVNQTKPMTDRMFKNAQQAIIEFLENTKAARLIRERKEALKRRHYLFIQMLRTLQPWSPGLPTPYEYVMGLAECRAIIEQPNNVTVTKANLRALKDDGILDAFTEAQNAKSRTFFANDVRKLLQDVVIPESTDPLSLAVGALFQCNAGGCRIKGGWAHMRTHWCHEREKIRTWNANDTYAEIAVKTHGMRGWDDRLWYNFAQATKHVVELAGLDPATTTPEDMDNSPVRFACSSCDDGRNCVTVFGWIGVAGHAAHLAEVYTVTPAAAECAHSLEPGTLAAVAKLYEEWAAMNYYCAFCGNYYSSGKKRDAVLEHLRSKSGHNIAEPKEGEHYCHVPLQDEWAYKRDWSVFLLHTKQTPGMSSFSVKAYRAVYFDFEEDKPAPEGFEPPRQWS